MDRDRDARARPARLDPDAPARRRSRQSRTETTALPVAARRRPTRVPRPPHEAAPATHVAVVPRARCRVHQAQRAPRRHRLTPPAGRTPTRHRHRPHAPIALPEPHPTRPHASAETSGEAIHTPNLAPSPHTTPTAAHPPSPWHAYCTIRANGGSCRPRSSCDIDPTAQATAAIRPAGAPDRHTEHRCRHLRRGAVRLESDECG